MTRVLIRAGSVTMPADLNETEAAQEIFKRLPLKAPAQVWGEEVYFSTDLLLPDNNPQAHVPPGVIAYWLPGKAICLFFGQAPASPVTIVGEMRGNPHDLAAVNAGDTVVIERVPEADASGQAPSP
jgi:hypothetical protein